MIGKQVRKITRDKLSGKAVVKVVLVGGWGVGRLEKYKIWTSTEVQHEDNVRKCDDPESIRSLGII